MYDYTQAKMNDDAICAISSIGLAHLGDAVYELLVRTYLCVHGKATGLEALFGWLYLRDDHARINELFNRMMEDDNAT